MEEHLDAHHPESTQIQHAEEHREDISPPTNHRQDISPAADHHHRDDISSPSDKDDNDGEGNGESPPGFDRFTFFVFMIVGCVQLLGWNSLLNTLGSLLDLVFEIDYPATVTATYSTVIVIFTIIFIKWSVISIYTLYFGLGLSAVLAILYGVVAQSASSSNASALFHVVAGVMAISCATIGSAGFGYAARFPTDYSGALSAGLGLSGVVSFALWMIFAYAVFEQDADGTRGANWVLCGVIAAFSVAGVFLVFSLFKQDSVKKLFAANDDVEEAKEEEKGTYEEGGLILIFKKVWWLAGSYLIHMMITLTCFPVIGPINWGNSNGLTDSLVGVFQVGDLIGRYAPNFIPLLRVKGRTAVMVVGLRLLFLASFILSYELPDTAVFGDYWFHFIQLALLSLTNGWICTVCFMRIPELVQGREAKGRVGSISLLATFLGIAIGQWVATGILAA